jgi:hypothetical protein
MDLIFRRWILPREIDIDTELKTLARHSKKSEIEIAHAVIADPAHYLFGEGKFGFEQSIEYRLGMRGLLLRSYVNNASLVLFGINSGGHLPHSSLDRESSLSIHSDFSEW